MFGTIRKHQTWLWVFLIVLMSVSLVIFFSSDASLSGGRDRAGGVDCGSVNGVQIPSDECLSARKEIFIARFLRTGKWPGGDEQTARELDNEIAGRVFLIRKLKELNIQPSDKAVALLMQEQIRDMPLAELESRFLASQGLTAVDYERFARHEVGRGQLMAAAGISGKFVRPTEAEALYRKEHQESAVQLALFWTSNFTGKVVITNGAISGFYSNAQFRYQIPARTILSYVEFPATNYYADADKEIGAVTNLEARLTEIYNRRNTNDAFFKDDKGAPLSEAAAKKKIREQDREQLALLSARRAANEFGTLLIEPKSTPGLDPDPNKLSNLETLAALRKLPVKTTKPFDALTGLEEFDAPTNSVLETDEDFRAAIRKTAASLSDATPIRFSPLVAPHAVFIIARKGMVPSELPPLEKVAEKVTNDYRLFMARDLAFKAGATFGTNVTNGLVLKKSFADICKAEGVQPVDAPLFSDSTQSLTNFDSRINLGMLQRLAGSLEPGAASHFQPFSQEGGLVLYVKERPKLEDSKVQAGMPEYVNQLRLYRQFEAFNQWFMKQATDAKLAPPRRTNETAAMPR